MATSVIYHWSLGKELLYLFLPEFNKELYTFLKGHYFCYRCEQEVVLS